MMAVNRSKMPVHKREELKRKEDEERTKEVYDEFVAEFEAPTAASTKAFVRGEVVNPEDGSSKPSSAASRLYKPTPKLYKPPAAATDPAFVAAKRAAEEKARRMIAESQRSRPARPDPAAKQKRSRLSNLQQFKEELKNIQEAREERRKIRKQLHEQLGADREAVDRIAPSLDNPYLGGTYDNDPHTTNLFMSNLNPDITIEDVYDTFGSFGPLASIKIMWARTEDERARGYLCGFVAFMTRLDADRAVSVLKGKKVRGFEMKMSWAKPVPVPPQPVYVPPSMMELTMPPPPSGLPFNAQPRRDDRDAYGWPLPRPGQPPPSDADQKEAWQQMIRNAVVKVVIPTERSVLCLIHRMIEFVIREGPMFEAMVMNREMNNPTFRFMFDNQSPAHVYYRWKLFSILQGNAPSQWPTKEFRMFENGSWWRPPPIDFFQHGMPRELYDANETAAEAGRHEAAAATAKKARARSDSRSSSSSSSGSSSKSADDDDADERAPPPLLPGQSAARQQLTDKQRDRLEDLLRSLTPERPRISEAMLWCLEHVDAAAEIVDCIAESLTITETPLHKKIARLYLVSDVLGNCGAKILNVSYYRKFFSERLEGIFKELGSTYSRIEARLKAEQFKQRVVACFKAWEETALYPTEQLIRLQNVFLGLVNDERETASDGAASPCSAADDLDGVPLSAASPLAPKSVVATDYSTDDLDGAPLDAPVSSAKLDQQAAVKKFTKPAVPAARGGFVASKWEELDPETVEKQAMTTSKWESLEPPKADEGDGGGFDDDLDGVPMDDDGAANAGVAALNTLESTLAQIRKETVSEERRKRLREIEVEVMNYQDELESGRKSVPRGSSVSDEVRKYRERLVARLDEPADNDGGGGGGTSEDSSERRRRRHDGERRDRDRGSASRRKRSRSRSPSPSKHRRTRSPRRNRSRSRSPSSRNSRRRK